MKLTRQASLVIALVCGFLAAMGALIWIKSQKPKVQVETTIEVPVAVKGIPAQTELRPEMFKNLAIERTKLPSDVVTTVESFNGQVSIVELQAEQPVRQRDIGSKTRMGLSFGIGQGYRALAVALDVVGTVGDFVKPGNRVDVLVAFEKENHVVVRTIAQDVEILTVAQQTSAPKPDAAAGTEEEKKQAPQGGRGEVTPVTLALTPAQAQIVLASDTAGKIRLALRGNADSTAAALPASNSWSLIGTVPKDGKEGPAQPVAPTQQPVIVNTGSGGGNNWRTPAAPQKPRRPSVEVIRGGQREVVTPD